jgi:hypothetical protein
MLSPAPIYLITQADLETAMTAEKIRELAGPKGKAEAYPALIKLILESAQGAILRQVQRACKLPSIYDSWVKNWSDLDKADLRRMVLSAAIHYVHFYGQKAEEEPDTVVAEYERVMDEAKQVGDHLATLANDPPARSSVQHTMIPSPGCGFNPCGFPRSRWRSF